MATPPHGSRERSAAPFHLLIKPIGPICNLDCRYCFYLEKESLYPGTRNFRMSEDVLERLVESYIAAHPPGTAELNFAWQGGEPTLMGIPFFLKALEVQQKYARPGMQITNALQTNGTLLNDDWARMLKEHGFLVGISIDGPSETHNLHRFDKGGKGSFDRVMRGLEALREHEVDFNTLTVLHHDNADDPCGLYDFLKGIGSTFLQFIPIVEHSAVLEAKAAQRSLGSTLDVADTQVSVRSVEPAQFGAFMCAVFDCWLECDDVGTIYVQYFDMLLGLVMGYPSSLCVHAETCGRSLAMEHNGDLYSCDHYVSPEYKLGNVNEADMAAMVDQPLQRDFGHDKRDTLPRYCNECRWLKLCWGVCPKDRIAVTPDGDPGLAYLCEGYKAIYQHTVPTLEKMAECLRMGHLARDYKRLPELRRQRRERVTAPRPGTQPGRNDSCPCGSGRKYKKCCGSARGGDARR